MVRSGNRDVSQQLLGLGMRLLCIVGKYHCAGDEGRSEYMSMIGLLFNLSPLHTVFTGRVST